MPLSFIEIETPRLILKSITPEYIKTMFLSETKEEIIKKFGFTNNETYMQLENNYKNGLESFNTSMLYFLIKEKETQQTIGECGFHTWIKKHNKADLFYLLHNDIHKNKGYMSEALPNIIKYGFASMGLHRIAAFIADNNLPSKKLLIKYGFTKEGVMRQDYVVNSINEDSDVYSLLKPEWQQLYA
jgi:ribosomal-protein-alanine N-acetyltransferase